VKKTIFILLLVLSISFTANAADGMISVESQYSVTATAERFEKILNEKGMILFNRINHSKNASKTGIQLRETVLIIFGNPKAGSPLMKCQQSIAIDLPQKALIWKDENNKVWISYNDISYLKNRHHLQGCKKVISKISETLKSITTSVSKE